MSATFGYRNYFGQYLCFAVPAAVISLFMLKSDKGRLCMLICCNLVIDGLTLTRTRAAWLGVFIALLVFVFLNRHAMLAELHNLKKKKKTIAILLVSLLQVIYFLNIPVTGAGKKTTVLKTAKTITQLKTDSDWGGRLNMYKSAAGIIKENPSLGIGLGNWRLVSPKYSDNNAYTDGNFTKITQRPHNDFLWLLSEVGIIGMIFIIGFLTYHLRLLLKALKRGKDSDDERYLFMFCLISLIAIGIESMFDFPRQRTMPNLYLWSIMGFIATTSIQSTGKDKYQNAVPKVLAAILSVVSVFAYFDLKSNIYSQDAKYYNNNNMPKELYASSAIALSFYRNLDNAGTPIYYYMGIAKHQLDDKNAAKLFFQKALQLAPFHIGALTNYMILLGELGELTSAHKIMSIIQHVYPRMAKSRLDMAKFYLKEGKNEEAEKILLELKENNLDDGQGTLDKLLLHVGNQ
jgi:O-antigen ligase